MKRKVNVVDIILVVTVLLLIGVTVYRYISIRHTAVGAYDTDTEYVIRIPDMKTELLAEIHGGDTLYTERSGCPCGMILRFDASYAGKSVTYTDGTAREHLDPDRVVCTVYVRVKADYAPDRIRLEGGETIGIGESVSFYTSSAAFDGIVTAIEPIA